MNENFHYNVITHHIHTSCIIPESVYTKTPRLKVGYDHTREYIHETGQTPLGYDHTREGVPETVSGIPKYTKPKHENGRRWAREQEKVPELSGKPKFGYADSGRFVYGSCIGLERIQILDSGI
jgi:hypothetical protein